MWDQTPTDGCAVKAESGYTITTCVFTEEDLVRGHSLTTQWLTVVHQQSGLLCTVAENITPTKKTQSLTAIFQRLSKLATVEQENNDSRKTLGLTQSLVVKCALNSHSSVVLILQTGAYVRKTPALGQCASSEHVGGERKMWMRRKRCLIRRCKSPKMWYSALELLHCYTTTLFRSLFVSHLSESACDLSALGISVISVTA